MDEPSSADALHSALAAEFPEVDMMRLGPAPAPHSGTTVVGRVKAPAEPGEVSRRLVERGLRLRPLLWPILFSEREWREVQSGPAGEGAVALIEPVTRLAALLKALEQRPPPHRGVRALLLAQHRAANEALEQVRLSQFPTYRSLEIAALVVRDVLASFVVASHATWSDDASLAAALDELGRAGAPVSAKDAHLYFYLLSAAQKERALYDLTDGRLELERWETVPWSDLAGLLTRLRAFVAKRFTTDAERRRTRRLRASVVLALVVLLGAGTLWRVVSRLPKSAVEGSLIVAPGGIAGQYFKGKNFEKKVLERVDAKIELFAKDGVLVKELGAENYSVRWQGYLFFAEDGEHSVCVERDDGARVYVDGARILDGWTLAADSRDCASVRVAKGWHALRLEYFQEGGEAKMKLFTQYKKHLLLVAPERLCCTRGLGSRNLN